MGPGGIKGLLEGLGLSRGPGIAVKQDTPLDYVIGGEAFGHDPVHDLVGNQLTGVHNGLRLATELCSCGYRSPQHVAGGDVHRAEGLHQAGALGSLARPLAAQDHQSQGGHGTRTSRAGYLRKPS